MLQRQVWGTFALELLQTESASQCNAGHQVLATSSKKNNAKYPICTPLLSGMAHPQMASRPCFSFSLWADADIPWINGQAERRVRCHLDLAEPHAAGGASLVSLLQAAVFPRLLAATSGFKNRTEQSRAEQRMSVASR